MTTHFKEASGVGADNPTKGEAGPGYSAVGAGHQGDQEPKHQVRNPTGASNQMDLDVELQAVGEDRSESSVAVSLVGPDVVTAGESAAHHAGSAAFFKGSAG